MTLREEILKNSGLLTEMPIIKRRKMYMMCVASTGWVFSFDNQKTLDADNLNDKDVLNYVATGKVDWYEATQDTKIDDTNGFIRALKKPSVRVTIYDDNDGAASYENVFIGNKAKIILRNLILQIGVDKLADPSNYDFEDEDEDKPTYEANLKTIHTLIDNIRICKL